MHQHRCKTLTRAKLDRNGLPTITLLSLHLHLKSAHTRFEMKLRTLRARSNSGMSRALRPEVIGLVKMPCRSGCTAIRAARHWQLRARCLAEMDLSPAVCIAPAPSTSWHVRELNTCNHNKEIVSNNQKQSCDGWQVSCIHSCTVPGKPVLTKPSQR